MPSRCPRCGSRWVEYRDWLDPLGRRCQACGYEWQVENDTSQVGDGEEAELVQRPYGSIMFTGP